MRAVVAVVSLALVSLPSSVGLGATYDLTGTWSYVTTNNWVTGLCPKGQDSSGMLTITQTGDTVTLVVSSGMVCDPASMCSFAGTVSGADYTVSNSAVVDNEGGVAKNTVTFTASSASAAAGQDSSSYTLDTFTCSWGFDITITRVVTDGTVPDGGGKPAPADATPAPDSIPGDLGATADGAAIADGGKPKDDDSGCSCGVVSGGGLPLGALALLLLGLALVGRRRGR
jgi:MYXO-CTERM domain-containing protein